MKSLFQISLASLLFFSVILVSCNKESYDFTDPPVDLPATIDTIFIDDPIALTVPGSQSATVLNGRAHWGTNSTNNSELYVLASDSVEVECPGGMSTTYNGGAEFFNIQFVVSGNISTVFLTKFRADVDGVSRALDNLVPPDCAGQPIEIEYEIVDDRISGTITGEFFYINPVYTEPFTDCANFVSAGIVEVSFDLPLLEKCFEV